MTGLCRRPGEARAVAGGHLSSPTFSSADARPYVRQISDVECARRTRDRPTDGRTNQGGRPARCPPGGRRASSAICRKLARMVFRARRASTTTTTMAAVNFCAILLFHYRQRSATIDRRTNCPLLQRRTHTTATRAINDAV